MEYSTLMHAMDELVSPASSVSGSRPVIEFEACEVPEQWLVGDSAVDVDDPFLQDGAAWGAASAGSNLYSGKPPAMRVRKRGRQPGPRTGGPPISHVEAEQQRRARLNRRFCDLRAAVPTVSRMDKASLLADATAYIAELRGRVELLEAEKKKLLAAPAPRNAPITAATTAWEETLEVRMVGREAAVLRLATTGGRHAPARLMSALRALDLPVHHACVSRVGAATVQDAVVDVPAALQDEGCLRAALLHKLQAEWWACN